ncbi:type IV pilus twitching motility protein PilT [Thermococcus sp.]|uniref:type IV pilus twitching motility protein PilT n=1 Tax=Thermococcus sp. TaxID=35749 RepID=UPI002621F5C9|nr:type IV pilus twitching motility protein PilT [Thermococcus sp.]MCD6143337.1 type IV pilus twitching motility protein PilT [Thermococcus sp.]
MKKGITELLKEIVKLGASDLHLISGAPPKVRIAGELKDLNDYPVLTSKDTQQLCYSIMTEKQRKRFEENLAVDFSFGIKGISRFRANVYIQRSSVAGAFRAIPFEIPSFEELGIPRVVQDFTNLSQGFVLITGPTGAGKSTTLATLINKINSQGFVLITGPTGVGKSTTLAALINKINKEKNCHIITIEDPIEFLFRHEKALISQREIGSDTESFASALKHVLRQDPDVILIGEMRDLETIRAALTAAETGHLVFATLHTNSASETITRIVDVFPAEQQDQIRTQLSSVLQGVVTQKLLKRKDGKGLVLAMEIMMPNDAIRNLIRENKIPQIYSSMQTGQEKTKMKTLNQSLAELYKKGFITYNQAMDASLKKEELKTLLERV